VRVVVDDTLSPAVIVVEDTVVVGATVVEDGAVVEGGAVVLTGASLSSASSNPSVTESRLKPEASTSTPGTRITTGDPRVTNVPAAGTCSTTVSGIPSNPSIRSTTADEPIVDRTPAANWTVLPTTDGTSTRTG
tara:strand:+ start:117 stop:518 length:402 start_codon:yes stop_codon:yes gene_type:complete